MIPSKLKLPKRIRELCSEIWVREVKLRLHLLSSRVLESHFFIPLPSDPLQCSLIFEMKIRWILILERKLVPDTHTWVHVIGCYLAWVNIYWKLYILHTSQFSIIECIDPLSYDHHWTMKLNCDCFFFFLFWKETVTLICCLQIAFIPDR